MDLGFDLILTKEGWLKWHFIDKAATRKYLKIKSHIVFAK